MFKSWVVVITLFLTAPVLATEVANGKDEDVPVLTEAVVHEEHDIADKFTQTQAKPFQLIGSVVEPGNRRTLRWSSPQSPGGFAVQTPVIVVNGRQAGPVLCLTAAIHGDELNGIEITRQVTHGLNPEKLSGTVVGVPIVNLEGFWRRDRYIGDRRDLNRYFPGSPEGSYPSRVAFALFDEIIRRCDAVVDFHTGSFYRENLPQLRVDLTVKQVADLSKGFGAITVLQNIAPPGSLRGSATAAGIPTLVAEIGGPLSLEPEKVDIGVKSLKSFMSSIGMLGKASRWLQPQPVYYSSEWIRADAGGILINSLKLGDTVKAGDFLAEIIDPVGDTVHKVTAPFDGTVLGRAQNQFVSPGFAIFRIGSKKTLEELEQQGAAEKKEAVERKAEQLGIEEKGKSESN
ncbi:MAG: succinylglutamate desuccinylase [Gammaproteobacteria bacterium]|nr:succinylglutamate desuccinylase [Gammaproteobacteria bacterium]